MMRVAFITHYADLYGANRSLLDLVCELRRAGSVEPFVVLPHRGRLNEVLATEGIAHEVFDFTPWMTARHYEGGPHHRLAQFVRHTRASRARSRRNKEILPGLIARVEQWGVDVVHANSAAVSIALELATGLGKPLAWHIREMPERHYGLHLDKGRGGFGRAIAKADHLICISSAVREDMRRYAPRLPRCSVVYNGVLTAAGFADRLLRKEAAQARSGPFTFVLVGVMHPSKGQLEAVEALSTVLRSGAKARLVLAGGGNDKLVRQRAHALGIATSVEFTGYIEDPFRILLQADAYLMCSRNEGMGRVTVEAMACALPVIGHASGGTVEVVEDGVTGLLYRTGADELAGQMSALITDPERARQLGRTGAIRAAERFTIERYAREVFDIYRSLTSVVQ
ncbi:MAG TPA: glycosyltransferase family 4 protein [Flavobacteriales bacterium]|nr:glycosyltransferase family 4 protein [Flavobacteriales bacterium]